MVQFNFNSDILFVDANLNSNLKIAEIDVGSIRDNSTAKFSFNSNFWDEISCNSLR